MDLWLVGLHTFAFGVCAGMALMAALRRRSQTDDIEGQARRLVHECFDLAASMAIAREGQGDELGTGRRFLCMVAVPNDRWSS